MPNKTQSIPGICDVYCHQANNADHFTPSVLIELPHGATRHSDYLAVQQQLRGTLPAQLEEFFFVNTDVGSPECAEAIGQALAGKDISTQVMRCLLPRTLIDCNRTADDKPAGEPAAMTAAIPDYVGDESDRRLLIRLHRQYHELVGSAYRKLFSEGQPALALQLHSYAPKSVQIDNIDEGIVAALRHAYEPEQYATWKDRPAVELITQTPNGKMLSPIDAVKRIRENFAAIEIDVAENQTYHLHRETWGFRYADQYPEQVLCIELNRGLLARPFSPFSEMTIGQQETKRLAAPIADALASLLKDRY